MPNFDSGSIMSYPLALRININKKQTNKQTNKQNFSALPTLMLVSVTIFSRAHSKSLYSLSLLFKTHYPFIMAVFLWKHQTRYHGQIFRIPSPCLFSVFHLYFESMFLEIIEQNKVSVQFYCQRGDQQPPGYFFFSVLFSFG